MDESSPSSSTSDMNSEFTISEITPESSGPADAIVASQVDLEVPTGFEVLSDMLGISAPDDVDTGKLKYVWDYYQKGRNREEAIDAMRADMRNMSMPNTLVGESYLHKFYSYVRILDDIRASNKEKQAYEQ